MRVFPARAKRKMERVYMSIDRINRGSIFSQVSFIKCYFHAISHNLFLIVTFRRRFSISERAFFRSME